MDSRLEKQHKKASRRLVRVEARIRNRSKRVSPKERLRRLRLGELRLIFRDRYGSDVLPNDDAGKGDLRELFAVISLGEGNIAAEMQEEATTVAPWLTPKEAERIIQGILDQPRDLRKAKADTLGKRLRLSYADRERLNIKTIGAYDVDKEERAELRKQRERERKAKARRNRGVKPRREYEAQALSRLKPWKAEGVCRRTWERRRARETSASASP